MIRSSSMETIKRLAIIASCIIVASCSSPGPSQEIRFVSSCDRLLLSTGEFELNQTQPMCTCIFTAFKGATDDEMMENIVTVFEADYNQSDFEKEIKLVLGQETYEVLGDLVDECEPE